MKMLRWYQIKAPSEKALGGVFKSLRGKRVMVRKRDGNLIVCASIRNQVLVSRVCQDSGVELQILRKAPEGLHVPRQEVYKAACGEEFYDPVLYGSHRRRCPKCKELSGGKVVAKLEPGQEFNLDGVIASLEPIREQLVERFETLDNLINNLKAYRDAKDKISELTTEVDKRIAAVKLLIAERKLPK